MYPATSGAIVASIAEAADGGVWYSDPVDAEMHRLDPVSGVVDDLPVPFPVRPLSVAPASDGSIWFGTSEPGAVGTVSPTGTLSLVPVSGSGGAPEDIAWGADGRLWMTQYGVPAVDALDPGSGVVTSYPVSAFTAQEIEAGADGALWLADGASITRLDLAGHEQVLPVPAATTGPAFPYSLRAGGAGLVYADTEGRILTVASDGTFTPLGPGGSGHYVMSLALAPDGALWYSDARSGSLGWG